MRIGIDPGLTGAIAFVHDGRVLLVDMPVSGRLCGKGQEINPSAVERLLAAADKPATVYIEAVHAMPGQGVRSVFSFGDSHGVLRAVAACLELPIVWVPAQRWKKRAGLIGKDKDCSRTLAISRHPELAAQLERKKDIGRAEALLIAEFGE